MIPSIRSHHNSFSPATLAVWEYLSELEIRHAAHPRAGVRPRIAIIARAVGYARATIFRALRVLEDAGVLRRNHRFRANGEQTSTLYVLDHLYRGAIGHDMVDRPPVPHAADPHNGQCDHHPPPVDNPVDNSVDNSASPTSLRADETPLEHSPLGNTILNEKYPNERSSYGPTGHKTSLPPWSQALDDAYDRYLWDPIGYVDRMRFRLHLRKNGAFVNFLTEHVPRHIDPDAVLEHMVDRLAELAPSDEKGVRRPQHWIAGYLKRLWNQGTIVKGKRTNADF